MVKFVFKKLDGAEEVVEREYTDLRNAMLDAFYLYLSKKGEVIKIIDVNQEYDHKKMYEWWLQRGWT